jgi:hypothetical protein
LIRTIEVLLVIIIIAGTYTAVSFLTVLPEPREVSPLNLRRLSLTTMEMLDSDYDLGTAVFQNDSAVWGKLQIALSASLPVNVAYNLTVYDVNNYGENDGGELYSYVTSISNAESLGTITDVSSYTVASSNVTYNVVAEKIGEHGNGGTLYILNCSDANGWWITGYTAQDLAKDLQTLLSQYFVHTVMVQNTDQLYQILNGNPLGNETLQNAVVINTFGEAVPIPTDYATQYSPDYTGYTRLLGQRVRTYNWTWASIVGSPLYYVSNTGYFTRSSDHNGFGIYGMKSVGTQGIHSFLQGLDNKDPSTGASITSDVGEVFLNQSITYYCNYYGIYPSSSQTSARALSKTILTNYHLTIGTCLFDEKDNHYPGAVYKHISADQTDTTGSFLAIGLARTPDIRLTALGLLSYYQPRLFPLEYTASGTTRLAVLQLGLMGDA